MLERDWTKIPSKSGWCGLSSSGSRSIHCEGYKPIRVFCLTVSLVIIIMLVWFSTKEYRLVFVAHDQAVIFVLAICYPLFGYQALRAFIAAGPNDLTLDFTSGRVVWKHGPIIFPAEERWELTESKPLYIDRWQTRGGAWLYYVRLEGRRFPKQRYDLAWFWSEQDAHDFRNYLVQTLAGNGYHFAEGHLQKIATSD